MKIEGLTWDSNFLGLRVGRSELSNSETVNIDLLKEWDLVYIYLQPGDEANHEILAQHKVLLADRKIQFSMDLPREWSGDKDPAIYAYQAGVEDQELIELGIQSGIWSRFNIDPDFGKENFQSLYRQWMRNSIDQLIADEVFVYRNEMGKPVGVITLANKHGFSDIGILAVDEASRGKNIGRRLVNRAKEFAIEHHQPVLGVVTQEANQNACKFYENCGFHINSKVHIFHYWKKNEHTL